MYQDNINGISVRLILDTRAKNKKGLYPVRVQVIFLRNAKYFSTGKTISEEEWNKLPTTRVPALVDTRNCAKGYYDRVLSNVVKTGKIDPLHRRKLTPQILGQKKCKKRVLDGQDFGCRF